MRVGNTPAARAVAAEVTVSTVDDHVDFFFDPVCPFAWVTSRWVEQVANQRPLDVQWRFIALRKVNAERDYDTDFPPGYDGFHTAGLRLLRVAAAVRDVAGNDAVGALYTAFGAALWDQPPEPGSLLRSDAGTREQAAAALADAGLDTSLADAVDDESFDELIGAETQLALQRAGKDVGTPILTFGPPDGPSFFGPVISRLPTDADALCLWDAVVTIARFDSFSELKRSLRELPALAAFGNLPD